MAIDPISQAPRPVVPDFDVPAVVKERAASNGHAPQGAVILTPPGGGGDVHGDPTVHSSES